MKKILIFIISVIFLYATNNDSLIIKTPNLIIKKGKGETKVNNYIVNNISPKSIKKIRKQELKLIKEKNTPLKDDYLIRNQKISYKEGQIVKLKGLIHNPLIIEFYDNMDNDLKLTYITSSSPYFTIEQDPNKKNRIFITPTQKFRTGTILIGTNVFKMPIEIQKI